MKAAKTLTMQTQPPNFDAPKNSEFSGSGRDQRLAGRLLVLDTIRRAKEIARIDIARATGISPATVTSIANELLTAGLIERTQSDTRNGATKRGRPREALKLAARARLIAGLKVATQSIAVLIVDFEDTEIDHYEMPLSVAQHSPEALCDLIVEAVHTTADSCDLRYEEISGICIGLAGQIDGGRGFVHWSSALHGRDVHLGALLAARTHCPVFIENDANVVAKAEQIFGQGQLVENFIVVLLESGIGMGIVINGQLYRGARGCSGEIGHTKVSLGGPLCQCGQRGCLEAHAAEYALLAAANEGGRRAFSDLDSFVTAARAGDEVAAPLLAQAERYFSSTLANIVNVFDPELIILAAPNAARHPLCTRAVMDGIEALVVEVDTPNPLISVHGWGPLMWAKGAAAFGIDQISALSLRDLGKGEVTFDED
jgi:transcriptional regulator of PTS gene